MTGDLIEHKVAESIETILQNKNFDESSTKKYHFVFHYFIIILKSLVILSTWLAPLIIPIYSQTALTFCYKSYLFPNKWGSFI